MPRNNWKYKIDLADIFHKEDMPFAEKRDEIVKRIRESEWWESWTDPRWSYNSLEGALTDLEGAESEDEFDEYWNVVYDLADFSRAWIATF